MTKLTLVQDHYEKETDVMDGEYIVATFYDGVNGESTHKQNAELFVKGFQENAELLFLAQELYNELYHFVFIHCAEKSGSAVDLLEKADEVLKEFA